MATGMQCSGPATGPGPLLPKIAIHGKRDGMATGTLTKWFHGKGCGLITPDEGGGTVFIHQEASGLPRGIFPSEGTRLAFEIVRDRKGRRAANARILLPERTRVRFKFWRDRWGVVTTECGDAIIVPSDLTDLDLDPGQLQSGDELEATVEQTERGLHAQRVTWPTAGFQTEDFEQRDDDEDGDDDEP